MKQPHKSGGGKPALPTLDTHLIDLKAIKPDLFNTVAREAAGAIGGNRRSNKPAQLRKFYDEIVMWDTKVFMHPDKFDSYLPFIRMLNAKIAYANGRNELVDDNFVKLMNHCLSQVEKAETLHAFKLFMEAFMGFYKQERPKE